MLPPIYLITELVQNGCWAIFGLCQTLCFDFRPNGSTFVLYDFKMSRKKSHSNMLKFDIAIQEKEKNSLRAKKHSIFGIMHKMHKQLFFPFFFMTKWHCKSLIVPLITIARCRSHLCCIAFIIWIYYLYLHVFSICFPFLHFSQVNESIW